MPNAALMELFVRVYALNKHDLMFILHLHHQHIDHCLHTYQLHNTCILQDKRQKYFLYKQNIGLYRQFQTGLELSVFSQYRLGFRTNYSEEMLPVCLIVCISPVTMAVGFCYGSGVRSDMPLRAEHFSNCLQLAHLLTH